MGGGLFRVVIRKMINELNNHVQTLEHEALQNLLVSSRYADVCEYAVAITHEGERNLDKYDRH